MASEYKSQTTPKRARLHAGRSAVTTAANNDCIDDTILHICFNPITSEAATAQAVSPKTMPQSKIAILLSDIGIYSLIGD